MIQTPVRCPCCKVALVAKTDVMTPIQLEPLKPVAPIHRTYPMHDAGVSPDGWKDNGP